VSAVTRETFRTPVSRRIRKIASVCRPSVGQVRQTRSLSVTDSAVTLGVMRSLPRFVTRGAICQFRACRRADDDLDIVAPGQFLRVCGDIAGARVAVHDLDHAAADTALPVHRFRRPGEPFGGVHGERAARGEKDADTDGIGLRSGDAPCGASPYRDDADERDEPDVASCKPWS